MKKRDQNNDGVNEGKKEKQIDDNNEDEDRKKMERRDEIESL